ncbi:hypothetical protein INR49_031301, partial [Caranx melampygus]
MELSGQRSKVLALILLLAVCVQSDFVEPPDTDTSLLSMSESQTRLPCQYQVQGEQKVVQVTWFKELEDGTKDQIITAHFTDGHTEFGRYSGRVKFESGSPTDNSALLIPSTEVSDEGRYTCHISTFPNGNFERQISLTVWSSPISSLDPVILVEGQSYRIAATCRSVAKPLPRLSWDTELPGQSQNRTSEGGSVSSHYSLHPLRSMNGKKLDYPPDATIASAPGKLYVGLEKAELVCSIGGYPEPQDITWTWKGGALPDGVSVVGERLVFGRALRTNDSGEYKCVVKNNVGVARAEYTLTLSETSQHKTDSSDDNLPLIIIGGSAGALVMLLVIVVLLVNRYHRHRNKKLEMELSERTEEILSLSRQASFRSVRRLNSVSTDPRVLPEDYSLLRVDSRMNHRATQLQRQPVHPGREVGSSGGVEVDELGRPVVWHDGTTSLRGPEVDKEEERRRRVESYLKSSNMSLPQPDDCVGPREPDLGHLQEGEAPHQEDWTPTQLEEQGHGEDDDSSSIQISEALNTHFYYSNGDLGRLLVWIHLVVTHSVCGAVIRVHDLLHNLDVVLVLQLDNQVFVVHVVRLTV